MVAAPAARDLRSSRRHPCPVCGRADQEGDCEMKADGRVFCHRGNRWHPPDWAQKPGDHGICADGQEWAYIGPSDLGNAIFKPHQPLRSTGNGHRQPARVVPLRRMPKPATLPRTLTLATLPDGAELPELNRERADYPYSATQQTRRNRNGTGGKVKPFHRDGKTTKPGAGPDPWPLFHQQHASTANGWPVEIEGERCAGLVMAAGMVGFCQPGHDFTADRIARRYRELVAAGVPGVVYLSDHDAEGLRKATVCAEAAAAAGLPFLHLPAAEVWPGIPEKGSIDDAPGTPEDHRQAITEAAARKLRELTEPAIRQQAEPKPFMALGQCGDGYAYRIQPTGKLSVLSVAGHKRAALLNLAPDVYWRANYGDSKGVVDWDRALSDLFTQGKALGTFNADRVRGRGVWQDEGRIVWHRGDHLMVDGQRCSVDAIQSRFVYDAAPALPLIGTDEPLDDEAGGHILTLIKRMGWREPLEYINIAGAAVLGPVCGALTYRPQTQITSHFGGGKTATTRFVHKPLWGGEGCFLAGSGVTEAWVRQTLGPDALPVVLDESEQENERHRRGVLTLARLSYDGSPTGRGTTHGQGLGYVCRSMFVLIGINAGVLNPADRSRFTINSRMPIPSAAWADLRAELEEHITPRTGGRLIARTVANLPTLLENIRTLHRVIAAMISTGNAERIADTYAPLLAGTHLLTSTTLLDESTAAAWLDSVGWYYFDPDAEDMAPDAEGRQCLDYLLSRQERWNTAESVTGSITVRELVKLARDPGVTGTTAKHATTALGRLGIKVTDMGLVVANKAQATLELFKGTRWSDGCHRERLRDIPGADSPGTVWIGEAGSIRVTRVPWDALNLTVGGEAS